VGKKFETLKVMSDSVLKAEECLQKPISKAGNLLDRDG